MVPIGAPFTYIYDNYRLYTYTIISIIQNYIWYLCFSPDSEPVPDADLEPVITSSSDSDSLLNNLLNQMKILQENENNNDNQEAAVMSEEKKNHIKSLLDAAKVESASSNSGTNSNNSVLKKSDLMEMIRSSGLFSEEDSAVIEKEIIPEIIIQEEGDEEILQEILEVLESLEIDEEEEIESFSAFIDHILSELFIFLHPNLQAIPHLFQQQNGIY